MWYFLLETSNNSFACISFAVPSDVKSNICLKSSLCNFSSLLQLLVRLIEFFPQQVVFQNH